MIKSNEVRFNEALETLCLLGSTCNEEIYKAYHGVLQWLDHQGNRRQAIDSIGERIALSGYPLLQSRGAVDSEYRKLVQALLLLLATRHKKSTAELEQTGIRLCSGELQMDTVLTELTINCDDIQMSATFH